MAKVKSVRSKKDIALAMVVADDAEKAAKKVREKARTEVLAVFGVEKVEVELGDLERSVEVAESTSIDLDNLELNDHLRETGKRKLVRSDKIDTEKLRALATTDKEVRALVATATKATYRVTVK